MANPFEVLPYGSDNLCRLLVEKSLTQDYIIKYKYGYLKTYLNDIGAKTLVVENEYFDSDHAKDIAAFYSRCFKNFKRNCTRFHFFSNSFTAEDFQNIILKESSATSMALKNAYLGFIVVKPLPEAIIGRTCLKAYEGDGRRQYPSTRSYTAHLYGMSLTLETLAFQEQNTDTAACASIALWSAFQKTCQTFQHQILSPTEVTIMATRTVPLISNEGLNGIQWAEAVRSVKLEPFLVHLDTEIEFRATLYAYLKGHIPVVLGLNLYELSASGQEVNHTLHAVTVTGYSLESCQKVPPEGPSFLAYRINEIYVHDDQLGPFAPMKSVGDLTWSTLRRNRDSTGSLQAKIMMVLVPLYPTMRISINTIITGITVIDQIVEISRRENVLVLSNRLEWDVYLVNANILKEELRTAANLSNDHRLRLITTSMPRFLWRARALESSSPIFELLFHATYTGHGEHYFCTVDYDTVKADIVRRTARHCLESISLSVEVRRLLEWYVDSAV